MVVLGGLQARYEQVDCSLSTAIYVLQLLQQLTPQTTGRPDGLKRRWISRRRRLVDVAHALTQGHVPHAPPSPGPAPVPLTNAPPSPKPCLSRPLILSTSPIRRHQHSCRHLQVDCTTPQLATEYLDCHSPLHDRPPHPPGPLYSMGSDATIYRS